MYTPSADLIELKELINDGSKELKYRQKFKFESRNEIIDVPACIGIKYLCCNGAVRKDLPINWDEMNIQQKKIIRDTFISNAANHHLECLNNKKDNNE